jgi:hypothetical protein
LVAMTASYHDFPQSMQLGTNPSLLPFSQR